MKRKILIIFFITITLQGFSQPNYSNENGTIIDIKNIENAEWIYRIHIQNIKIGNLIIISNLVKEENILVYKNHELDEALIIGELKCGDFINIEQIAEEKLNDTYSVWLKVHKNNILRGWIFLGKYDIKWAKSSVPYFNNRWEIIEYINMNNRIWTIRNMVFQDISVWDKVINIRDNPGLIGTKIISQIVPPKNGPPLVSLKAIAATEETETIDNINDRWIKINYDGIEGWVYGGNVGVERGGPKYFIPEIMIFNQLGRER